jgi:hypothetical protein
MKITLTLISLTALSLLSMSCNGYTITISDPLGRDIYSEPIDGELNGEFFPEIEPAK